MSVRDPRDPARPGGVRAGAAPGSPDSDPLELRKPRASMVPAADRAPRAGSSARPDPTGARLAAGMVGAAATTAILAAIVAGASGSSAVAVDAAAVITQPVADVPVRHVTQVVHIPSDATPPPRKVVYATPVPAPAKPRVVVITTTQSGTVIK
jgi:hypothetical protein